MKIYNTQNQNNLYFTSRFNIENYTTKRALNYLKRTISEKKGLDAYFDSFLSRLATNNKGDVLELAQFEKYYIVSNNTVESKPFKIRNKNLIEDLESFIIIHNKKAPK